MISKKSKILLVGTIVIFSPSFSYGQFTVEALEDSKKVVEDITEAGSEEQGLTGNEEATSTEELTEENVILLEFNEEQQDDIKHLEDTNQSSNIETKSSEQQIEKVEEEEPQQVEALTIETDPTLKEGVVHESVIELKEKLTRLGFGGMNINEVYGSFTAQRVSEFQAYYGLTADGIAGESTLEKLDEILSSPLQEGVRHPDTIELKEKLGTLGYGGMNINDMYGSFTALRVSQFQADHGLKDHGIVCDVTLDKIEELLTSVSQSGFEEGVVDDSVIELKQKLTRLGFGGMNINEVYGSFTVQRVSEFQAYYGLTSDGIAGERTLEKLDQILSSPFQEGIRHPDTIELKEKLGRLGYGGMNVNDMYGSFTALRVSQFQADHGLKAHGIACEVTLDKIEELLASVSQSGLEVGVVDDSVIELKQKLTRLGFGGMNINAVYGSFTAQRVSEFQAYYGLPATGVADERTFEKLDEILSTPFQEGVRHADTIELKKMLTILGYGGMNLNDMYGSFTALRVSQFQSAQGLRAHGIADEKTLAKMDEAISNIFRVGSTHDSVIQLKKDMTRLGFGGMNINGVYGSFTAQRVGQLQAYYGLPSTGKADKATLRKIGEILSSPFQVGVSHVGTIDLKEKLTRLDFGNMNINEVYGSFTAQRVRQFQAYYGLVVNGIADERTLAKLDEILSSPFQEGREHNDVIQLKENLTTLGYGNMNINPVYGSFTAQRVREFQADHGLRVHGIADEVTLAKIDEQLEQLAAAKEVITFTQYNLTLTEAANRQLQLNPPPQTDMYRNAPAFIHSSHVDVVESGVITGTSVNLRTTPRLGSSTNVATTVSQGTTFTINGTVTGDPHNGSTTWYEINYGGNTLYVHSSLASNSQVAIVRNNAVVRESANTSSHIFGARSQQNIRQNAQYVVNRQLTGSSLDGSNVWYEISFGPWRSAKTGDFTPFLDPSNNDKFQHLVLDKSVGVTAAQLNNVLSGRGVFHGRGQAFIDAGRTHSVNEVYLIAHAMLESGNGTSRLATGIEVGRNSSGNLVLVTDSNRSSLGDIRTTYNMYGIGANDDDPYRLGAIRAYNEGWFTPEAAIIGGARFISNSYFARGQNTLYKMRWNHLYDTNGNGFFPQYATDMGWAVKQLPRIKSFYDQLDNATLHFDIVRYR
ncbi:peptidoglycan-binding protein [Alkalihalobacterium chitinilyticum]|uniref:Peptidoglycan-binding protein n=1 Tax=Alkalihalobacterium chitinilyticum TaxID=2980103 RepID=A0ABT5VK50_9BACI|nr:peptidoglycan-binding protein [Alkalihalobacterium chitinilyticum]MDE5415826.1 peptidoglycan-binding protein [Alkalihalobacterium chitinilyticum]